MKLALASLVALALLPGASALSALSEGPVFLVESRAPATYRVESDPPDATLSIVPAGGDIAVAGPVAPFNVTLDPQAPHATWHGLPGAFVIRGPAGVLVRIIPADPTEAGLVMRLGASAPPPARASAPPVGLALAAVALAALAAARGHK